ncbi:Protein of unknown function DUF484 [hydrothermal vent metagenome]|uniref:DUF484 family protein n=1 Tax=hydrothermal vent metagenome TaxID=652676 RepID=A0A1W1BYE3_9ZZZZ
MNKKQVKEYLEKNLDFLDKNLDLLQKMEIPHPKGIGTISLLERQVEALREQNEKLTKQITQFAKIAKLNYEEQLKVQNFVIKLLNTKNNTQITNLFNKEFIKLFDLEESSVLLWQNNNKKDYQHLLRYLEDDLVFCGFLKKAELKSLFKKDYQSIAMLSLGTKSNKGLMIFTAKDSRFLDNNLATDLLEFIAKITNNIIK